MSVHMFNKLHFSPRITDNAVHPEMKVYRMLLRGLRLHTASARYGEYCKHTGSRSGQFHML